MPDIRHRVGINAPIHDVYQALATTDGLTQWWTRDVRGDSQTGATPYPEDMKISSWG